MSKLPNISQTYPPFLTPAALDKPYTLVVKDVQLRDLFSARDKKTVQKYVVSFRGANALLACSKAIANSMANVLGDDPNKWAGQNVTLVREKYNGKDCIRATAPTSEVVDTLTADLAADDDEVFDD